MQSYSSAAYVLCRYLAMLETLTLLQDFVALVVQAVGGADASQASKNHGDYNRVSDILPSSVVAATDRAYYRGVTSCWPVSCFN